MKRIISFIVVCAIMAAFAAVAQADEYFIICNPKSCVNVRFSPKRSSEVTGRLEIGDKVTSDGEAKNGFMLCGVTNEYGEGWVYKGYLVDEKPRVCGMKVQVISNGRVACRQYVNGKRQGWIKPGQEVFVYAYTSEWALTKKGFVKTKFLDID